jgi:hypothetical protein
MGEQTTVENTGTEVLDLGGAGEVGEERSHPSYDGCFGWSGLDWFVGDVFIHYWNIYKSLLIIS